MPYHQLRSRPFIASLYHGDSAPKSVAIGVAAAVVALGYSHPSNFTMILKTLESLEGHPGHLREADPTLIKAIATVLLLATLTRMKWEEIKVVE